MHVLVTGAAGFIGSTLADRLLVDGHAVTGVDDFDPYYDRAIKEQNLAGLHAHRDARFLELDLAHADLAEAFDGVDAVVHLAARPGVRGSWGEAFAAYLERNVLATQRLLEASVGRSLRAWVYASSASVYGDGVRDAVAEDSALLPHNPYGTTKAAGEHLARLYREHHGVPTLTLRYFSVYGPRERPDKAIQRFLLAAREGRAIRVHGDGLQRRDFTFVDDAVESTARALTRAPVGETLNVARGRPVPLLDAIRLIERVTGSTFVSEGGPPQAGDVATTSANVAHATTVLGYSPRTDLEEGIRAQWARVLR